MRKTIGALLVASPVAAITVYASVVTGAWWVGPVIVLGTLATIALVAVGMLLLMGE